MRLAGEKNYGKRIRKRRSKVVCIYGRKMEWLQYNLGRKSILGAYANREGWKDILASDTERHYFEKEGNKK